MCRRGTCRTSEYSLPEATLRSNGIVGAELILKGGLLRLHNLELKLGLPLYPIIGAGSVPFRGHLTPVNVERAFTEYPTAHTFTVQSAFKYDYE